MNAIPRVLDILMRLRMELRLGRSLPSAIEEICRESNDLLSRSLRTWLLRTQSGQNQEAILNDLSPFKLNKANQAFIRVLERGINGSPIDDALADLEEEFFVQAQQNYEKQLQLLPLKLLIPLTLFILPGTMCLILGPVIYRLLYSI